MLVQRVAADVVAVVEEFSYQVCVPTYAAHDALVLEKIALVMSTD